MAEGDRKEAKKVKEALVTAFAVDSYVAYEQFVARKLRRLASLFGELSDKDLACVFVSGLPEGVHQLQRTRSRLKTLDLDQILTRARAVVKDECALGEAG